MAVGDKLTVARYNSIQTRINAIIGVDGYGQPVSSSPVSLGSKVTLIDYLNLRTDMIRAIQHQTGADPATGDFTIPAVNVNVTTDRLSAANHGFTEGLKVLFTYVPYAGAGSTEPTSPGGLVYNTFYYVRNPTTNDFQLSATPSSTIINLATQGTGTHAIFSGLPVRTSANKIIEADALNLEDRMTTIEDNRFVIAPNQSEVGFGTSSQRTIPWNTTITHQITVNFGSTVAARNFFNSGGEIRTRASLTGFSGPIGTDWNTMLTNMGTVKINFTATTATGTGTGSLIGFFDLTTTNQQVFTRIGSGAYAANDYTVLARRDANSQIIFLTIQFNDDKGPNPNFDESVTGTITSTVEYLRAAGSGVSVPAPTFTTTANLQ